MVLSTQVQLYIESKYIESTTCNFEENIFYLYEDLLTITIFEPISQPKH